MDFGTQVLSGGWYAGKGFWTVDVSIKGLANIRAPKTLFEFMKKGNGSQSTYDIRNIRAYAEAYLETGVGYSRPITDKLTAADNMIFSVNWYVAPKSNPIPKPLRPGESKSKLL